MPPATEQTWRNQKILHVVFGASAVVMMIATLWLIAKDHNREWKDWQLQDRKKEARMILARRDFLADQFSDSAKQFDQKIIELKSSPINPALIESFKATITKEDARLEEEKTNPVEEEAPVKEVALSEEAQETEATAGAFPRIDNAYADFNAQLEEVEQLVAQGEEVDAKELNNERQDVIVAREDLLSKMQRHIREAKRRENGLVGERKFVAADRTAAVSELGLMIGGGEAKEKIAEKQSKIDGFSNRFTELTEDIAEAKEYRMALEEIIKEINEPIANLVKEKSSMETELERLDDLVQKNTSNVGEWITRWPVLNALYDGNVRIDQIWLPDMTINYNFSNPARFDRCKTCHQAISKTAPGTASEPAYPTLPENERSLTLSLVTPVEKPGDGATLLDVYGLALSDQPLVGYEEAVIVHYVRPESPASKAGLTSGDTLFTVNDVRVFDSALVNTLLLQQAQWDSLASIEIRRGLPHPFTTHPRLDLYLTDSSPHPEKDMGCTICHDGQGSGTEFKWASHTPDNASQHDKWISEYEWFDNHHWIFPMKPSRFVESNCMKCHHEKAGLERSERFPEPPAPKLVKGWTLAEEYGCFGCHEINGYDGPDRRIGPDLRIEPNYDAVALQMLRDPGMNEEQRGLAEAIVQAPMDSTTQRDLLLASVKQDKQDAASLTETTYKIAEGLKTPEAPGSYRKVGPSLRYLSSKVEPEWLYSWIRRPADFRPSTKMPQFFGLHEHLQDVGDEEELDKSEKYEPIEIRALTEFLLANSQDDFQYLEPPQEVTEAASVDRGKWLFETRGCLACHAHDAFPGIAQDQGPDLSRISAKFTTIYGEPSKKGALWLYSWLKQPHKYHVRTKMPDLYLDPIAETDPTGEPTGKITDPAADITAFLLGSPVDWEPTDVPTAGEWSEDEVADLADLAVEWLASDAIPSSRAEKFVEDGIPDALEPKLKADEKLLLKQNFDDRTNALKHYVARRTISKYGCFGCHDIPGYEDAKPIGTALNEWGRKDTSKLAFEQIHKFLEGPGKPKTIEEKGHDDHGGHGHLNPADFPADTSYYVQAINSHARDGFVWQKLRMPRSYDYKTTRNKGFNERLRMPMFPFDEEEREAVITFVLGLVNEPPAEKYIYNPKPEQKAIVDGRKVLERFNCAGCHTMEMETWQVAMDPNFWEDFIGEPDIPVDYPFLTKHFTKQSIAESEVKDQRGMFNVTLRGMPTMSEETGEPQLVDEEWLTLTPEDLEEFDPYYRFTLWDDALINGETYYMGVQDMLIPAKREGYGPLSGVAYPAWGGELSRYLFPQVIAKAQESNPQVKGVEAWGWLPPPLMNEGEKVQPDWLHGFLMDPTSLRPAVVMRMPNFHMSSDEASQLVNYFAAKSKVEFPYEYKPQRQESYLAEAEAAHPERLQQAMNIVVDGNYCVKCHPVGDFYPKGDKTTFGPNLANAYRRLRPEYVRNWVANPKRILPYTGMPVNIIYKPDAEHLGGVAQKLFQGTSLEQLRGLVDLLMNFDVYAQRNTSITPQVEAATAASTESANASQSTTPLR